MTQSAGNSPMADAAGAAKPLRGVRVLHVGPLPPDIGGIAAVCAGYMQSRVAQVCNVRHLRQKVPPGAGTNRLKRLAVRVLNAVGLVLRFLGVMLVFRPRIVHVRTGSYGGFYVKALLVLLARATGAKALLHVHGGEFERFYTLASRLGKRVILWSLRRASRVIAISRTMKGMFERIGLDGRHVEVIEDAVALPAEGVSYRPQGAPGDPVCVLFLNRATIAKGVLELIDAVAQVHRTRGGLRCDVYGPESPDWPEFRSRIAQANAGAYISLSGATWGEAKERAFRAADIYVLPSHVEALPNGLLEGMSYGLPCIATNVGGVPTILQDGQNGLMIPAKDSAALAGAIERLAGDAALRRRLGQAGRQTVIERFTWDRCAEKILRLYADVLSPR